MSDLAYPSSAKHLAAFRQRMRQSPSAKATAEWLEKNLAITQASNARSTHRWLLKAGLIDDAGVLTPRGHGLLAPDDSEDCKTAAGECVTALLGEEVVATLRSGNLSAERIDSYLGSTFRAGASAVSKAKAGLAALTLLASDSELAELVRPSGAPGTAQAAAGRQRRTGRQAGSADGQGVSPPAGLGDASHSNAPLDRSNGGLSQLLSSGVLQIHIDANWPMENIERTLRLLQKIDLGEVLE